MKDKCPYCKRPFIEKFTLFGNIDHSLDNWCDRCEEENYNLEVEE